MSASCHRRALCSLAISNSTGFLASSKRSSILGILAEVDKVADERHTFTSYFGKSRRFDAYGTIWFSKHISVRTRQIEKGIDCVLILTIWCAARKTRQFSPLVKEVYMNAARYIVDS